MNPVFLLICAYVLFGVLILMIVFRIEREEWDAELTRLIELDLRNKECDVWDYDYEENEHA